MKVGFLLQDTGSLYGAQRATLDLLRGLADRGVPLLVGLIRETRRMDIGDSYRNALAECAQVIDLPVQHAFSTALARDIHTFATRNQLNILHSVGDKADVHAAMAFRKRDRSVRLVTTVHGWLFLGGFRDALYRWANLQAFRRFDRVIALSRWYESLLRQHLRTPVVRIPSGIDPSALDGPFPPIPPFTFGFAARFSAEKNHVLLLRAVRTALAAGASFRVIMAGDGPLLGSVREEIKRAGLSEIIETPGHIPRNQFIAQCHALVQCSRIENLPYAVLEAMAARRPVLATHVGGLPDLITHGVTGCLVSPGDHVALAAAMQALATSEIGGPTPSAAERMGFLARIKLEREFSPTHMLDAHLALYRELTA